MPCQRLDLKWPGMAEALREHVRVGEVDADLHPSVAEACGVAQFPSLKVRRRLHRRGGPADTARVADVPCRRQGLHQRRHFRRHVPPHSPTRLARSAAAPHRAAGAHWQARCIAAPCWSLSLPSFSPAPCRQAAAAHARAAAAVRARSTHLAAPQHAPPPAHLRRVSAARRWKKLQSTTVRHAPALAAAPLTHHRHRAGRSACHCRCPPSTARPCRVSLSLLPHAHRARPAAQARSIRQGHILPALSPLRVRRAGCVGGTHGAPRTAQEMRAVELFDGRVVVLVRDCVPAPRDAAGVDVQHHAMQFGVEGAYVDDAVLRDFVRHASALRSKVRAPCALIAPRRPHPLHAGRG